MSINQEKVVIADQQIAKNEVANIFREVLTSNLIDDQSKQKINLVTEPLINGTALSKTYNTVLAMMENNESLQVAAAEIRKRISVLIQEKRKSAQ